jgi:hypothetical protein
MLKALNTADIFATLEDNQALTVKDARATFFLKEK